MRITLNHITPLLAAGAAAVAIAAAPIASATASDAESGSVNVRQSPGNVEITNPTPPVSFFPYGNMPYLLGGHGGLRGGGR